MNLSRNLLVGVALTGLLSLSAHKGQAPIVPPTVLGDAAGALGMGVYPLPFTEIMHSSVEELLRHVAASKIL